MMRLRSVGLPLVHLAKICARLASAMVSPMAKVPNFCVAQDMKRAMDDLRRKFGNAAVIRGIAYDGPEKEE